MHMKTEKISSSLRKRPWRIYVLCAVGGCSRLEAQRRRTHGRRVLSEYVAQRRYNNNFIIITTIITHTFLYRRKVVTSEVMLVISMQSNTATITLSGSSRISDHIRLATKFLKFEPSTSLIYPVGAVCVEMVYRMYRRMMWRWPDATSLIVPWVETLQ